MDDITGPQEEIPHQPQGRMRIIAINVAILAGYTLFCRLSGAGWRLDMYCVGFHVLGCISMALCTKKWILLLAALLVLLIGVSTCGGLMGTNG